jgi:GMP synthase-like glutamine amidotransferase
VSRVFAFRHGPSEHLGLIAGSLAGRRLLYEYLDLYQGGAVPGLEQASGLIFLGGPMSVNDDLPYLRIEEQIILKAFARSIPILGICLGAQLIAKALESRVYANAVKEIGWFPVRFTEAARADRLFAGLDAPETVFHWHGETFDLPQGAELLASSERCRHQAFRAGNAYALQFHLEVTPEMIAGWCAADAGCGDMREINAPIDPYRDAGRLRDLSQRVFGRWCDLVIEHQKRACASR